MTPGVPTVVIRADASPAIGAGHVLRCLALAQALADQRDIHFALATVVPAVERRIRGEGYRVHRLDGVTPGSPGDAQATAALIHDAGADWIVVDGAQFDDAYQREVLAAAGRLALIDDLGQFVGVADLVVNHGLHAGEALYEGRTRPGAVQLLGPRYALLRREFGLVRARPEAARAGLLVLMGGTDAAGVTMRVVDVLLGERELPPATVVIGSSAPGIDELRARAAAAGERLQLRVDETDVADVMARAVVAIAAAGGTTLELCCLAVPALLLAVAPNQVPVAEAAGRAGVAVNLGWHEDLKPGRLLSELWRLLEDHRRRARMAALGRALVDGHGAERVARVICGGSP